MDVLIRTIERLTGSVGILASFAIVPLTLATCYEVFARYAMNAPTVWAYEIGYAVVLPLMIWLSTSLFSHLATGYLRHERSGQSAMNLPVWPFRVVFFVAFTLLAAQLFVEVVKSIRILRSRG